MDSHQFEKRMESLIEYYKKDLDKNESENMDEKNSTTTINSSSKKNSNLDKPEKECLEYQKLLSRQKSKK
jgi:hypothetical protein